MANTATCPECHLLDRVIRVRSVYSGGIASGTAKSSAVGVTFTGDRLAPTVLRGTTNSISQSDLSKRLEPLPAPTSSIGLVAGIGVGLAMLITILLMGKVQAWPIYVILVVSYGIFLSSELRRENFRRTILMPWYEKYFHAWENLYYCETCDIVFAADSKMVVRSGGIDNLLFEFVGRKPQYGGSR